MLLGLLLVLGSLGTVRALDQSAMPGGAPEPRNGPFRPAGYVRAIDGESLEALIDGRRTGVAVLGVAAPMLGTPCGDAAKAQLQALIGRGVTLADDPGNQFDSRQRRIYHISTSDGRSVAAAMVGAGLARTTGLGPEASTLAAAESKARSEKTGCVWGGPVPQSSASGRLAASAAATIPPDFADEVMASNLNFPTGFAFLPDGRALVTEKGGTVRLVTSSGLQPTPVLNIASRVNNYADRGLLGIAIDPNFATNSRFYLFYVYESNPNDVGWFKSSQVARFTLGSNGTADPNAGVVILGKQPGVGCPTAGQDCLPAENWSHSGGGLRFGTDGSLYVSTGDASSYNFVDVLALRALDIDNLAGKVLRVTTEGKGLNTNPHWNGNADAIRSKVFARGFRNPFRIAVRPTGPAAGSLFVGDVGWGAWEEVTYAPAGTNAGWPCFEGNHVQDGYRTNSQTSGTCQPLASQNPPTVRAPIVEWDHSTSYGAGGAAMAGTFYNGTAFPAGYRGALFYADYAHSWMKYVTLDANNQPGVSTTFADGMNGPVQIESGPDGAIWYLAFGTGELRRIRYTADATPIQCPDNQFRAEYFRNTELSGVPSIVRCEPAIDHDWDWYAPFPTWSSDQFSARWTGTFTFGNDTYDFKTSSDDGVRLKVDGQTIIDNWGSRPLAYDEASRVMTAGSHTVVVEYFEDCCPAIIRASWTPRTPNTAPVPTIASPLATHTFKVGETIQLQGSATDAQQGTIASENLRWDIVQKHCPGFGTVCHDHHFLSLTGANRQFVVDDHGDGSYFEIRLTATDSGGLTGVATRQLDPKTIQVTLAANPSIGTVTYDGVAHPPSYTTTTIANSRHQISAQPPAGQSFGGWAHGGAQEQFVTVGEQNVTYTASMGAGCAVRPPVTLSSVPAGPDARLVTISTTANPSKPNNRLRSIRFLETRAARIERTGQQPATAPVTFTYPDGPTQTTFTVRRTAPGSVLARFEVTDDCGVWPTFIGTGSPSGF